MADELRVGLCLGRVSKPNGMYLGFWWTDFDGVKSVLGVLGDAESDSEVLETL